MFDTEQFLKDRHEAFSAVLYNDSTEEMKAYGKKYKMTLPQGENAELIIKAAALKAIQVCTDFTLKDKALAAEKAIEMGISPYYREGDRT